MDGEDVPDNKDGEDELDGEDGEHSLTSSRLDGPIRCCNDELSGGFG